MDRLLLGGVVIAGLVLLGVLSDRQRNVQPRFTDASIRAALVEADSGDVIEIVSREFPEEFQEFLTQARILMNSGSAGGNSDWSALFELAKELNSGIRRDNAHYLENAPIRIHQELLGLQRDRIAALKDDPLCGRIATTDFQGLPIQTTLRLMRENPDLKRAIDQQAVLVLKGIVAGRDNPVEHLRATEDDVLAVYMTFIDRPGMSEDALQSLLAFDANDPILCPALIEFFDILATSPDPGIGRFGVEMSVEMASH